MSKVIYQFQGEHRWLSNFWPVPDGIVVNGITFSTVEHAYQAMKFDSDKVQREVAALETPGQAKRYGKSHMMERMFSEEMKLERWDREDGPW